MVPKQTNDSLKHLSHKHMKSSAQIQMFCNTLQHPSTHWVLHVSFSAAFANVQTFPATTQAAAASRHSRGPRTLYKFPSRIQPKRLLECEIFFFSFLPSLGRKPILFLLLLPSFSLRVEFYWKVMVVIPKKGGDEKQEMLGITCTILLVSSPAWSPPSKI